MPDGSKELEVLASVAGEYLINGTRSEDEEKVKEFFRSKRLQMLSFTITEKGYALRDIQGALLPQVKKDLEEGPDKCRSAIAHTTALLLVRYKSGACPLALVSMHNCSHNGDKLKAAVLEIAKEWTSRGYPDEGFIHYLKP